MWDLSSPTMGQSPVPHFGRQILYPWTTKEVPWSLIISIMPYNLGIRLSWSSQWRLPWEEVLEVGRKGRKRHPGKEAQHEQRCGHWKVRGSLRHSERPGEWGAGEWWDGGRPGCQTLGWTAQRGWKEGLMWRPWGQWMVYFFSLYQWKFLQEQISCFCLSHSSPQSLTYASPGLTSLSFCSCGLFCWHHASLTSAHGCPTHPSKPVSKVTDSLETLPGPCQKSGHLCTPRAL